MTRYRIVTFPDRKTGYQTEEQAVAGMMGGPMVASLVIVPTHADVRQWLSVAKARGFPVDRARGAYGRDHCGVMVCGESDAATGRALSCIRKNAEVCLVDLTRMRQPLQVVAQVMMRSPGRVRLLTEAVEPALCGVWRGKVTG